VADPSGTIGMSRSDKLSGGVLLPSTPADKRYPWIDTLRGIAILMVIAVHASHGLKGSESLLKTIFGFGGYGVQLFFVASAMTLCMSLENNYGKPRGLIKYVVRRYFRIVLYFFWD